MISGAAATTFGAPACEAIRAQHIEDLLRGGAQVNRVLDLPGEGNGRGIDRDHGGELDQGRGWAVQV